MHHRLAKNYRSGPFLLVGDAAHVHSPAGGQGMNTGLVDACVLGRLLPDVLAGRRPPESLGLYETLRRPAAREVLALAARLTRLATLRNPVLRSARNLLLLAFGRAGAVQQRLTWDLSGLSRRASAAMPEAGGETSRGT